MNLLTVFPEVALHLPLHHAVISLYKVNEFTVAENDDPSYTNLGFDAPIQAVKPNKAISEIVTPIEELCPIILKNCVLLSIRI